MVRLSPELSLRLELGGAPLIFNFSWGLLGELRMVSMRLDEEPPIFSLKLELLGESRLIDCAEHESSEGLLVIHVCGGTPTLSRYGLVERGLWIHELILLCMIESDELS